MARIIAVANQKGGTGKTTTAVSLGACLAELGRRVLLVDLDAQGNASTWLGAVDGGFDLLTVFMGERELGSLIRETHVPNLSLVPSSRVFAKADLVLANEASALGILKSELDKLNLAVWDYVFLDCPPALSTITVNALVAAHEVLIPAEATSLSTSGIVELCETIGKIQESLNPDLAIAGILLCRYDGRTRLAREVQEKLTNSYGGYVFDISIRQNVRIAEAHSFKQPITAYDPLCATSADYRALALAVEQERTVTQHG